MIFGYTRYSYEPMNLWEKICFVFKWGEWPIEVPKFYECSCHYVSYPPYDVCEDMCKNCEYKRVSKQIPGQYYVNSRTIPYMLCLQLEKLFSKRRKNND